MRLYQIILGIPDGLDPDTIEVNVPSDAGEAKVFFEGYIGDTTLVELKAKDLEAVAESESSPNPLSNMMEGMLGGMMGGMMPPMDEIADAEVIDAENVREIAEESVEACEEPVEASNEESIVADEEAVSESSEEE